MKSALLICLILFTSVNAGAAPEPGQIDALSDDIEERVIAWRRDIHQHPELGFQETRTAALVAEHLQTLAFDEVITGVGGTGVVGILKGSEPGAVVALRADMDALPIKESTGLPFASTATAEWQGSQVPVMHACGHDAHVAMLLGAAEVLARLRQTLPGTVMFVFQPAEEGSESGGGAEAMLQDGLFDILKPDAIFGLHVAPYESGSLHVRPGPTAAASDTFEIAMHGEGTHGAMPWGGQDSLSAAAQAALSIQSIISRRVNITNVPAIVSVGTLNAGTRHNVVPSAASLSGTIRTFDEDTRTQIHELIATIAESSAATYGVSAQTRINTGYPVLVNDGDLLIKMRPALERTAIAGVHTARMGTASEDFSYYAGEVPGLFITLGAMPPGVLVFNHSPNFTIDEGALKTGVRTLSRLAISFLTQKVTE